MFYMHTWLTSKASLRINARFPKVLDLSHKMESFQWNAEVVKSQY